MEPQYTIGRLARAAGLPTSTVRYYERVGLLRAPDRSEGNYRLYDQEDLDRLRFIRAAQAIGFTIENIRTIVQHDHGEPLLCEDVRKVLENRLADVEERLSDLRHVERVLRSALETCRKTAGSGSCEVIDRLSQAPLPALEAAPSTSRKKRP